MQSVIRSRRVLPTALLMLLCLIGVPSSRSRQDSSKSWAIIVNLTVDFPPGIESSVKPDILEPRPGDSQIKGNIRLTCDAREDCRSFELQGVSLGANKPPSHFIFRMRSPGFEPQIVNTGIISWYRDSSNMSASYIALQVTFSDALLPTLEHVIELNTTNPWGYRSWAKATEAQVLEASVFNPTSKQVNLTALRARSVIARDMADCEVSSSYTLFDVSLKVDGPSVKGILRPLSPADSFTYPLSGHVVGICGGDASIVVTGKFDRVIEPNERAFIRLKFDDSEREAAAKRVIEKGRNEVDWFKKTIGKWQIGFQVDEQFWIIADTTKAQ